jgi:hypothetical protein
VSEGVWEGVLEELGVSDLVDVSEGVLEELMDSDPVRLGLTDRVEEGLTDSDPV